MKTLTSQLIEHFNGNLTTLCTCWKVTKRNGGILGFTDHDVSLTIDDLKYIASSGYYRTAISNSATTAVDNLEVSGFLDDDSIGEVELRNGAFDFAQVEIFAVNWNDLSQGICRLRYGYFGEVSMAPSGQFTVELRGLMQLFSQTVGETISPECRADLGDDRCKVQLVPSTIRRGYHYEQGDRVIVPSDTKRFSISVPIINPTFSWIDDTDYFNWHTSGAYISNYPEKPKTGLFYIKPTSDDGIGFVRRYWQFAPTTTIGDASVDFYYTSVDDNYEIGVLFEFMNAFYFAGQLLGLDAIETIEVPYQLLPQADDWTKLSYSVNEDASHSNVNYLRVTVRWRPKIGYTPTDAPKIKLSAFSFSSNLDGDYVDAYQDLDYIGPGNIDPPGWSGSSAYASPGTINLMPQFGSYYLANGGNSQAFQVVDLTGTGVDFTELDAGKYNAHVLSYQGAWDWGQKAEVDLTFLNSSGQTIDSYTDGYHDLRPLGNWFKRDIETAVPENTRSVRIDLHTGQTDERIDAGASAGYYGAFDLVQMELIHVDANPITDMSQFGGIEYEAQNAGTSGTTIPDFTQTLDEEVTDGDITWKAVTPKFAFYGEVNVVTDHANFTVTGINAPDNWFLWGVLTFLSGNNQGRAVEVLAWNNTTKAMNLMLPVMLPIEEGDKFTVHAGCDKSRGHGGCFKFSNILNFRGEPEVPGTDQYFKVGGTGVGAGDAVSHSSTII